MYYINNSTVTTTPAPTQTPYDSRRCYCDPVFQLEEGEECNPEGCLTLSIIFLILYLIPIVICISRFYEMRNRKDSAWSIVSLVFLFITSLIRIIRSILLIVKFENYLIMGLTFVLPLGILICSYFNTLYVWVKIIHHINFSKMVSRVFPFLGKVLIGSQIVLMVLLIATCLAGWSFYATNTLLLVFLIYGGVGCIVFVKMIWQEYRDLSDKDCGVFSQTSHERIQKVLKLSSTAIVITILTVGMVIWSFKLEGKLPMSQILAYNFIGRFIEIVWIGVMLLVLAPKLQSWGQNSSSRTNRNSNLDDLSDSSIDIESNDDSSKEKDLTSCNNSSNLNINTNHNTSSSPNVNNNSNQSLEVSENLNNKDDLIGGADV
ncbi:hypothetical protein DDB_G0270154 [Dictyostelium discoideum AX4]|uniref:THH1/TOM1/TOM3 domain-containing protein n=1 Tax=Dictyostelium discoideum TaxID=44689 RepID=Q55C98_DICDI|nr:hypothetical protein DDB_G0270154 [Dictyostelium discoideum AX4]EAL72427.1 hypothetical protein DDB_G0270154 [Dictyostelium discoideum AX4]|eukprot:XP_646583.1 hypothetical protein DDB_G0270154 [Dictyostelium discoideum AX4]